MNSDWVPAHLTSVERANERARSDALRASMCDRVLSPCDDRGSTDRAEGLGLVPHTGFEPVISALRGRCPGPLDECGPVRPDATRSRPVGMIAATPRRHQTTHGGCRDRILASQPPKRRLVGDTDTRKGGANVHRCRVAIQRRRNAPWTASGGRWSQRCRRPAADRGGERASESMRLEEAADRLRDLLVAGLADDHPVVRMSRKRFIGRAEPFGQAFRVGHRDHPV